MSVAFRRESDDEHKEPVFEIPIAPGPNLVTPRGLSLIRQSIAELEAAVAAAPDEDSAKPIKRDLRYWQTRLATAEVAPPPPDDEAGIGSRLRIRLNGAERTVSIVGGDEADPARGLIAFASPLGRVLNGAMAGDLLDFNGVDDAVHVLAIDRA